MNLAPLYRSLSKTDALKVLNTARSSKEWLLLAQVWVDPNFEYHVDLPHEDNRPAESMDQWLHNEGNFQ